MQDLSKYKNNPKTAHMAAALAHITDEESRRAYIAHMDAILAGEGAPEAIPKAIIP